MTAPANSESGFEDKAASFSSSSKTDDTEAPMPSVPVAPAVESRTMARRLKMSAARPLREGKGKLGQGTPGQSHLMYQGRLHGALAHRMGVDILRGLYKSGEILPNEIESSSTLDISRSAYREAIRILAAKGMVESRPKTGTRVTERARWNLLDPEVLGWMFETEPSRDFIRALFELRLITEPAAAALAAERRTDEQIESMRLSLEIMKRETLQTEAGRRADLEFHHTLIQATDNEALASLSSSIEAAVTWTTRYKARHNALTRDPVPDHERVFEAVAAGDAPTARLWMETLIRMAHEDTQRTFAT